MCGSSAFIGRPYFLFGFDLSLKPGGVAQCPYAEPTRTLLRNPFTRQSAAASERPGLHVGSGDGPGSWSRPNRRRLDRQGVRFTHAAY